MCIAANGSQDVLFIPFRRVLCSAGSGPLHDQEDKTLLMNLPISSFFWFYCQISIRVVMRLLQLFISRFKKLTKNWPFSLFAYWWIDANEILAILIFFPHYGYFYSSSFYFLLTDLTTGEDPKTVAENRDECGHPKQLIVIHDLDSWSVWTIFDHGYSVYPRQTC
jgi:hypothetical protein